MYNYIEGTLVEKKAGFVVLDVQGVGYKINTPLSTMKSISQDAKVKLFTTVRLNQDGINIYGFADERERDLFEDMIEKVPNLGPQKAIAILSSIQIDKLIKAISESDIEFLRSIKGIGDKLATRIVIEFRDKLPYGWEKITTDTSLFSDAVHGLMSLGYSRKEAEQAVSRAIETIGGKKDLDEVIKKALEFV